MLQKKNSIPTGKALATGLLAAWMSVTPIANASGPNEEPANDVSYTEGSQPVVQQVTAGQMVAAALQYSINNDAVGIFVNKAPDTDLTAEQIGSMIVKKFQEEGVPAAYISNVAPEGALTTVSYFLDGVSYSDKEGDHLGYALDDAFSGFELVSATYKALKEQDASPSLAAR